MLLPFHRNSSTIWRHTSRCIGQQLGSNTALSSGGAFGTTSRRTFATVTSKVSALSLNAKKRKGKKITMVTAYDYPSSIHVARAGIDVILVGDSVAMVELGHETTQRLSMEHILHHCISVKQGLEFVRSGSMLVGDMPFGSYEYEDTDVALRNAYRFIKEGGCDAVKLEVGSSSCFRYIHLSAEMNDSIIIFLVPFLPREEVQPEQRQPKRLWMEVVSGMMVPLEKNPRGKLVISLVFTNIA